MISARFKTNAFQLARKYQGYPAQIQRGLERVARVYAPRIQRHSRSVLQAKIYAKPIPRRPVSGKPKWRRTGELKRSERAYPRGIDIWLVNDAPHAEPRRDLGTPRGRRIVSAQVEVVDWQSDTRDEQRAELLAARREAVQRVLKG